MRKIITLVNSKRTAIALLIILNLIQIRALGLVRLELKKVTQELILIKKQYTSIQDKNDSSY